MLHNAAIIHKQISYQYRVNNLFICLWEIMHSRNIAKQNSRKNKNHPVYDDGLGWEMKMLKT